jgi:recombination protein RecT
MNAIAIPSDNQPATANTATIGGLLTKWAPVFSRLLAETGVSEETFTAQIAQAYRTTKNLDRCSLETVLGAGLRCAQLGLTPNDGRNHAWIIPRKNQGRDEATFQLGYAGVMELARRAVPGLVFDGRAVFPNDVFELDYGKREPLTHKPNLKDRGGEAYAWYVRATFPDGTSQIQALDKAQVEYHREFSQRKTAGMWADSYDAAALKSCVVDLKRWLPQSPQLAAAIKFDNEAIKIDDVEPIQAGDITPAQPEALTLDGAA